MEKLSTREEASKEMLALRIRTKYELLEKKNKVELDGLLTKKEEMAVIKVRGEALREKEDLGAFVIPIRLEAKVNLNALVDTGLEKLNRREYGRKSCVKAAKVGVDTAKNINENNEASTSDTKPVYPFDGCIKTAENIILQTEVNLLREISVWERTVSLLGALHMPLENLEWKPCYQGLLGIKLILVSIAKERLSTVKGKNGNSFVPVIQTTTGEGSSTNTIISSPRTAEEKLKKKNDVKARTIEARFGGNEATNKTQKTLLKQIYKNFSASKDLNLKFLRCLPSEWNTHVVVWRNKPNLDTMGIDDCYNNFKIVEQEVKGTTTSSLNSQNVAFISTLSPDSTNEVNTAYRISTAGTQSSTASTQLVLISPRWSVTTAQECDSFARSAEGPNIRFDMVSIDGVSFDWSYMAKDEVSANIALMAFLDSKGLASVEEQLVFYKNNESTLCENIDILTIDMMLKDSEISMLKSELEKAKQEKEGIQFKINNFDKASKSLNKLLGSQITDKSKHGLGFVTYNAVPPPTTLVNNTGRCAPPTVDLSYSGLVELKKPEFEGYRPKSIEEQVSDDLEKKTVSPTASKVEFVKTKEQIKPVRKTVSFNHLQSSCNYHQRERVVNGNNYSKVNYNYSPKKFYPNAPKNMIPRAIIMKTGLKPLNIVRHVNTAHPKTIVFSARPMTHIYKSAQSTIKRPFQMKTALANKNFNPKVNNAKGKFSTARLKAVNTARQKAVNTASPSQQ
ncbi:hypothetical protein Tco_1021834 [Tanacetum coccineum]